MSQENENAYAWPNWDNTLGKPPVIKLQGETESQRKKFDQILTNLADLSHATSAVALRDQFKKLSGEDIYIDLKEGKTKGDLENLTGARGFSSDLRLGDQPIIKFNPDTWGKYPAKGAQEIEKPHEPTFLEKAKAYHGLTDQQASEGIAELNATRGKYSAYGIAPPEQQFVHELGHYIMLSDVKKMVDKSLSELPYKAKYLSPGEPGYTEAVDAMNKSTGPAAEQYVIDHYETPAMKSINLNFIERDGRYHQSSMTFSAGKNGIPAVGEEEKKALESAQKIHLLDPQSSNHDQLSPEQKIDLAINYINTLPEHQRAPYTQNVLDYAAANNIKMIKQQDTDNTHSNEAAHIS